MSLIDREKLLDRIGEEFCDLCLLEGLDGGGCCCESCNYGFLIKAVKEAPTVDAVEVVRCKDCKYGTDCICVVCEDGQHLVCEKFLFLRHVTKNFYCAYGERKDGEQDGAD